MDITSVFRILTTLAWMAVVGLFVLAVVRASRNRSMPKAGLIITVMIIFAVGLTIVSMGLVFVDPQERGVVISAIAPDGYRKEPLEPGLHWIIPVLENVVRYPISKQTYTMSVISSEGQKQGDDSISARTADGQEIFLDSSVFYEIDPAKVVQVHIQWQNRYPEELVRAQARGIIRDAVSQYGVTEVVSTKRFDLVNDIRNNLTEKLSENGLTLVDFVMRNIAFSKEYAASVEQKQIAEQQAQQAKFVVESKKQEAEQARQVAKGQADAAVTVAQGAAQARLIQAEAEAKALALINSQVKDNPGLLTYTYISKLAPNIQVMFLPSNAPFLFPLPEMGPKLSDMTTVPLQPTPAPTQQPTPAQ